jgi:hypothetical protein
VKLAALALILLTLPAAQLPPGQVDPDRERVIVRPGRTPAITAASSTEIVAAARKLSASGGTILLRAGVTYPGPVALPARPAGSPTITITTRTTLPNRTLTFEDRRLLATIAPQDATGALRFENGANDYRVEGVAFTRTPTGDGDIIVIQNSSHVHLDRIVIDAAAGQKRAIRGNGRHITLTRSWVNGGAWPRQDSQAFCAWDGAGPYTITRNYLAASGENILFGGADNLGGEATNPADILVEGNVLHKPQQWRTVKASVKNLLELKNATRVVIRNNLLDGNWTDAQDGWAVVFTPTNQDGRAPWTVVKDVRFERNYIVNTERGINLTGHGFSAVTQQTSGIVIRKNVFETSRQFLQVGGEVADLTVEGNVTDNGYNIASFYVGGVRRQDGRAATTRIAVVSLEWVDNVHRDAGFGIHSEAGIGEAALAARTNSWEFINNALQGLQYKYPSGTASLDERGFQAAKARLLAELGR